MKTPIIILIGALVGTLGLGRGSVGAGELIRVLMTAVVIAMIGALVVVVF